MSKEELAEWLTSNNLLIVSKDLLEQQYIEAREKLMVDKRVKWISAKEAIAKYNVTRYWLNQREFDIHSLLKVSKGAGKTSTKKYLEQSIINEQLRMA